ncbi:Uncharacterized protein PBTT_00590 [Plasmodiophora brassicae]
MSRKRAREALLRETWGDGRRAAYQQDLIRKRRHGRVWTWSVTVPQAVDRADAALGDALERRDEAASAASTRRLPPCDLQEAVHVMAQDIMYDMGRLDLVESMDHSALIAVCLLVDAYLSALIRPVMRDPVLVVDDDAAERSRCCLGSQEPGQDGDEDQDVSTSS